MSRLPLLAAALLAAGPAFAAPIPRPGQGPPAPTVTAQTLPGGQILERVKAFTRLFGGDAPADLLDANLKAVLGEKGFAGLDTDRPVGGYAYLTPDIEESWAVVVLPITTEAEFKELVARVAPKDPLKVAPVAGNPGLYRIDPQSAESTVAVRLRFSGTHAYVSINAAADALDPKNLVPAVRLIDSAETAPVAARLDLDNLDPALKKQALQLLDAGIADAEKSFTRRINWGRLLTIPLLKELKGYAGRVDREGDRLTARLVAEPKSADLAVDFALAAKKGTALAKDIAAFPATTNRFAGAFPADALGGGVVRVPGFSPELRTAAADVATAIAAEAAKDNPGPLKPVIDAIGAASARTLKDGNLDLGGAFLGPDKAGLYTAVGAVALDDTAGVEKALWDALKAAPPPVRDAVKLDAEKAGGLSVHAVAAGTLFGPDWQKVFGEKATVYVAFGPKAVYAAVGPAGLAELRRIVALKPGAAPVMDLRLNMKRLTDLVRAMSNGRALLGAAGLPDRLLPMQRIDVAGGPELRVKVTPMYLFGVGFLLG